MADQFSFNIITPRQFVLSDQSPDDLRKIRDEIMDKLKTWESRMGTFFKGYAIASDSWRIKPSNAMEGRPKTLFNSKSGETHRAVETLCTLWQRMLTASDPNFEATKRGLNPDGTQITEEDLFATTAVLEEQQRASGFKRKLLRSLRSMALMGVTVVEKPFVSLPYGHDRKNIEFTDWVFRPMYRTGFDTSVYDIKQSDYIFFIDFCSKWMLRNLASQDTDFWDIAVVEQHIKDYANGAPQGKTDIYSRVVASRARAGYTDQDASIYENLNYHGRLDPENPVIQAYAESIGLEVDPKYVDWSVGLLDGESVCKFHMTQYGDWRTRADVLSYKDFEDEPLSYGVGQLGRKLQRTQDILESLADDKVTFDILNMFKVGKYSGYDTKQFVLEPLKMLEMEDVTQMMPLVGDPNTLKQALEMLAIRREDLRNIVGAPTNLQGEQNGGSATEAVISQKEAIRSGGVHAELLGETLRDHLEICHVNNLNYLDEPIWVGLTGNRAPRLMDKNLLPINVGFKIKIVTDKDFRPEEIKNLIQTLQIFTSVRQMLPQEIAINGTIILTKELFRKFGQNPALLSDPVSPAMMLEMQAAKMAGQAGGVQNEVISEGASEASGQGAQGAFATTPMGPVPTSPDGGQGYSEASA